MIRAMQNEDINRLAEIYYIIFTSDEWRYDWLTENNVLRYFTDMYNTPQCLPYVYIHNGVMVGGCFGDMSDYFNHVQYYIKEIFIERTLQSKGAGSKFLAEIETDLYKRGVENITLFTSKKIHAYGFYHKNGYTDGSESVFMLKILNKRGF